MRSQVSAKRRHENLDEVDKVDVMDRIPSRKDLVMPDPDPASILRGLARKRVGTVGTMVTLGTSGNHDAP